MNSSPAKRTLVQSMKWFDPRHRQAGAWAFILNRITGIGLTVYLFLHLAVLGTLARGSEAYDGFIVLAKSPPFVTGELLVVVAGLYHGLNRLRGPVRALGSACRNRSACSLSWWRWLPSAG